MSTTIGTPSDFGISTKELCNFYAKNWQRKIALSDEKFYQWQFVDNPVNAGTDECCIAVSNDEIVGIMGLTARDFNMSSIPLRGAELTTWVVSENHRNKGSGPSMIEYLKNKYDVMVGMGISNAALPVYLRNGFRYIKSIPRFVHVINWNNIEEHIEYTPLAKKYAKSQVLLNDFKDTSYSNDIIDDIYKSFSDQHCLFSRSSRFIKWRYDDNPYFKYHHYIVNGQCHVSIRIDSDIDGFIMAHCVDIIGDSSSYSAAISSAIAYAAKEGADAIDFYSTNASLNAELNKMGLFSTLDHDFFNFPHLFHPIEMRNPASTSLIIWAKENMHHLLNVSKLHITKQDADFDRPTMQVIK